MWTTSSLRTPNYFLLVDWSPSRRHLCFCEGPPLPPPLSYSRIGTTMYTKVYNFYCSPMFAEDLEFCLHPKSPPGSPFCFLGSPSPFWELGRWPPLELKGMSKHPSNQLLKSWVGTWDVLISKAELKAVMGFTAVLVEHCTRARNGLRKQLGVGWESNHNVSMANWLLICQ